MMQLKKWKLCLEIPTFFPRSHQFMFIFLLDFTLGQIPNERANVV